MAEQPYNGGYSGRHSGDNTETAEILKEAITIVDKLATLDADEVLYGNSDYDELEILIDKAKKLKKHRLWKLK